MTVPYYRVKVDLKPVARIMEDLGVTERGDAQRFHTSNVLRRMVKYMPYRTGATIKITQAQSPVDAPQIVTDTPYADYIYYGKVMVGHPPKHPIDKDLVYTKTKNPLAGPFWDRRLVAAEGDAIQADLENYIKRKAVKA